uniref:Uncharacterized protein n=1 Tax=Strigamia maritima TaxID=126957 RepID=T1IUM9_STRMM
MASDLNEDLEQDLSIIYATMVLECGANFTVGFGNRLKTLSVKQTGPKVRDRDPLLNV